MDLNTRKIAIGVLILIAIVVGWQGLQNLHLFCEYEDKLLCKFTSKLDTKDYVAMSGGYEEMLEDESIFQVDWSLRDGDQEVVYFNESKEQMHVIIVDQALYLQDYTDGRWWKQPLDEVEQYTTQIPFQPKTFFDNLIMTIENPNSTIVYSEDDVCGSSTCRKYTLRSTDTRDRTLVLYIDENEGLLRRVQTVQRDVTQTVDIVFEKPDIIPPDRNIKVASADDNIFLENYIERAETSQGQSIPDYVQQFEQSRREAENQGFAAGAPNYVDSSATPTPTGSQPNTPTPYSFSDDAEILQNQIESLIEEGNYCIEASDCVVVSYRCPFACTNLVSKDYDTSVIEEGVSKYNEVAQQCVSDCGVPPSSQEIECISNICVDTRSSSD